MSCVRRAVDEGTVRVCGGFSSLPPFPSPGFIVEVTSKHGKTWPVAVVVDQIQHYYHVQVLFDLPWKFWDGKPWRGHPVYDGDTPNLFQQLKDECYVQNDQGLAEPS
jgi:hypothetical protein